MPYRVGPVSWCFELTSFACGAVSRSFIEMWQRFLSPFFDGASNCDEMSVIVHAIRVGYHDTQPTAVDFGNEARRLPIIRRVQRGLINRNAANADISRLINC